MHVAVMNSIQLNNTAAAKAPPLAVQPFGLTNFQSKIVGPLLTEEWEALRGWSPADVNRIIGFDIVGKGVTITSDDAAYVWQCHRDQPRPLHAESASLRCSFADGLANLVGYAQSQLRDAVKHAEQVAGRHLTTHDEARTYLRDTNAANDPRVEIAVNPPVQWLPFAHEAGFPYERAASVAMCGFEVLYLAVSKALIDLINDDAVLEMALGRMPDLKKTYPRPADYRRHGYIVSAYREGSRMSAEDEDVKLLLLAEILQRRIVFVLGAETLTLLLEPLRPASAAVASQTSAVVVSSYHVGFVRSRPAAHVFAFRVNGEQTSAQISHRGIDAARHTSRSVIDSVFRNVYGEQRLTQWLSKELQPCSFALHSRTRIYHVEIAQSKIKSGKSLEALISAHGFGRDKIAAEYLQSKIPTKLVPLHVDADGHCLAHSISRCLIGKEYLWHALRTGMFRYLETCRSKFEAFWQKHPVLAALAEQDVLNDTIQNADPSFYEKSRSVAALGLGSEHIFAFANLLRRPILLFDGPAPHAERYLFLPLLEANEPMATKGAIAVGWWSAEHLHYVPIVPQNSSEAPVDVSDYVPSRHDGLPMVYGLDDPTDVRNALDRAFEKKDGKWIIEVGGSSYDTDSAGRRIDASSDEHLSRTVGDYVVSLFEKKYGVNVWCVHEVARAASVSDHVDYDALFQNPRISSVVENCLRQLNDGQLRYCQSCTATSFADQNAPCRICRKVALTRTPIDRASGSFALRDEAMTAIEADSELVGERLRPKTWINNLEPVDANSIVFARESASCHSVARVTAKYTDPLSGMDVVDVTFLAPRSDGEVRRFATPMKDILNGYPVDLARRITLPLSVSVALTVHIDANEQLCTSPEATATYWQTKLNLSTSDTTTLTQAIMRELEDMKNVASASQPNASFAAPPPLEEGDRVLWESYDVQARRWIQYSEETTAMLESSFVANPVGTTTVQINGYIFTIDFEQMQQLNSNGATREVRRVVGRAFACPACTFINQPMARRCEMCDAHAPQGCTDVTHNQEIAKRTRERRIYEDSDLAAGGKLFDLAEGASVCFFNKYKMTPFVLVPKLGRYVPVMDKVPNQDGNPLYDYLTELERHVTPASPRPPFSYEVRLIRIDRLRFVRDRDTSGKTQPAFVCSLFGRRLKTPNFLDFALADQELHIGGSLFNEARRQGEVTSGITLPTVYGPNLYFMRSVRSHFGRELYVPVSKYIRQGNPLFADISQRHDDVVRRNRRHELSEFEFQGWRLMKAPEGHFEAVGTVETPQAVDETQFFR